MRALRHIALGIGLFLIALAIFFIVAIITHLQIRID